MVGVSFRVCSWMRLSLKTVLGPPVLTCNPPCQDLEEDKIWITDHEVQKGMSAQNVRELKVKTVKKGTVLTQKDWATTMFEGCMSPE